MTAPIDDRDQDGVRRVNVLATAIHLESMIDESVLDGEPCSGWTLVGGIPGLEVGIWEHTPGVTTDVEDDEVFVVVAGRATVTADGGETREFGPGDIGFLKAGTSTTWRVHETLRKVFVGAILTS